MEVIEATSHIVTPSPKAQKEAELVLAPKDFFIAPIFAATKQEGPRRVTVRVNLEGKLIEREYLLGGFNPLRPDRQSPALDVRHGRALLVMLSFRGRPPKGHLHSKDYDPRRISFSLHEFCRKFARTNGGKYSRYVREILADLAEAYIRVVDLKTDIGHSYRLIERVDIVDRPIMRRDSALADTRQRELRVHGCYLSKEFYDVLNRVVELQHIKLDILTSIRSPLAQAIYLYIPSRAHHHTEDDPFQINLTTLLEQVSFPVPNYKSLRHKLFTQNANSIIKQLDGLETLNGLFHAKLAETADGLDWKLLCWEDQNEKRSLKSPETSKLLAAWLKSGRSREVFGSRLRNIDSLNDYEIEQLQLGEVEILKNRRFLEMSKALLGTPTFDMLAAEAKGNVQEGRKARKNPTARLIHRVMTAIGTAC